MYASVLQQLQAGKGRESLQQLGAALSAQGATASPIITDQYQGLVRLQTARDSLITMGVAQTNPDVKRIDVLEGTAVTWLSAVLQGIQSTLAQRLTTLRVSRISSADVLATIPASDADEARLTGARGIVSEDRGPTPGRVPEGTPRGSGRSRIGRDRGRCVAAACPGSHAGERELRSASCSHLSSGSGFALVIEHLDQSIRGRDDVETSLQLPGLAVIPRLDNALLTTRVRRALTTGSNGAATAAAKPVSNRLVTVNDSRSVGAEAYRTLRTKLLFSRALSRSRPSW